MPATNHHDDNHNDLGAAAARVAYEIETTVIYRALETLICRAGVGSIAKMLSAFTLEAVHRDSGSPYAIAFSNFASAVGLAAIDLQTDCENVDHAARQRRTFY